MAITDLDSYLPTMDEFIQHWTRVNAALNQRGDGDAVLRDGCTLGQFAEARGSLAVLLRVTSDAEAEATRLRFERDYLAEGLRGRLLELQDALGNTVPDSHSAGFLSSAALLDPHDLRYLDDLDRAFELWREVETIHQIASPSGSGSAQLCADVRQFRGRCRELKRAQRIALALAERRRRACEQVMSWLQNYRALVRFGLGLDPTLRYALPARTPASYRPPP